MVWVYSPLDEHLLVVLCLLQGYPVRLVLGEEGVRFEVLYRILRVEFQEGFPEDNKLKAAKSGGNPSLDFHHLSSNTVEPKTERPTNEGRLYPATRCHFARTIQTYPDTDRSWTLKRSNEDTPPALSDRDALQTCF